MEPGSTQMQKVTPKQLINARIWGQGEVAGKGAGRCPMRHSGTKGRSSGIPRCGV